MATQLSWVRGSNATDADFRAWVSAIHAALASFGWVRTADSGQIDTATATVAGGGYSMWRMADALQATYPVFLRLGFTGNTSATNRFSPQLGTGSNGSGTLTGPVTAGALYLTWTAPSGGSPDASGNYLWLFSGSTSRFAVTVNYRAGSLSQAAWLIVERLQTAAGADGTSGALLAFENSAVNLNMAVLPFSGAVPAATNATEAPMPSTTTGVIGADVVLYPLYPFNVRMLNPVRGVFAFMSGLLADEAEIAMTIYGQAQTVKALPTNTPSPGSNASSRLAMRWD